MQRIYTLSLKGVSYRLSLIQPRFAVILKCSGSDDFNSFQYNPTQREKIPQTCMEHAA